MGLRDERRVRNLTQDRLAEVSGVSQATISAIETRRIKKPSWHVVQSLADALEVVPERVVPAPEKEAVA